MDGYIWLIAIVAVGAFFVYSHFSDKKRAEETRVLASDLGFTFSASVRGEIKRVVQDFVLFNTGSSRTFSNELWGSDNGMEVALFEYGYREGSGQHSSYYDQTVLYIRCNDLNAPQFELGPEYFFHKIGSLFGYQDIDFDYFPGFSRKYLLRGKDESAIRAFFTPEIIACLEELKGIHVEAKGPHFIYFISNETCKPDELQRFYQSGRDLLGRMIATGQTEHGRPEHGRP